MTGHISIWRLSHQLGTYPELIAGLCIFNKVDIIDGSRGRMVRDEDAQLVADLLYAYKSRPKLSYMCGRGPRRLKLPAMPKRVPHLV